MLEQSYKDQIQALFANLKSDYQFQLKVDPNHPNRKELTDLLTEVASCSERISCVETVGDQLEFSILRDSRPTSILFRAVPTGHEFTTLLLAILNMDGIGKNLPDELVSSRIKALKGPVNLESYISLSCTNCPDVVQSLNVMSILNGEIHHAIIDGAINQSEVEGRQILAVPSIYLNGELLHVGRSTLGELLTKMEAKLGSTYQPGTEAVGTYDVLVAGGGPAGVAAAIYSARKGLKVAIVANQIGGQVAETVGIENMISIPQTTGSQLVANLKSHLGEYPVDLLENRTVESVDIVDGVKHIKTSLGETLTAPALIIATGASWRRLNVPGEKEYIGAGVAFCAHCDGPFYKGKRVAVIGGGNSGLEAAIDLSNIAAEVTVLEYMEELKGDQILRDKIQSISNIKVLTGVETLTVAGDGTKVTGLSFRERGTGTIHQLALDAVFVQIGLKANSQNFSKLVEVNRAGEIVIDAHCRTNQPGIYAAGDVSVVPFKQIIIAMGEGAKAALTAFEDKLKDHLG